MARKKAANASPKKAVKRQPRGKSESTARKKKETVATAEAVVSVAALADTVVDVAIPVAAVETAPTADNTRMANTKLKLLRLLELLQRESTQRKPLTTAQICQKLEKMGMHCERRTLYRDIKLLIDCGYDIGIITDRNANLYYCRKAPELSFFGTEDSD